MIELERHIEILLLSNDCVIVPELGGFMAHHVDAHYDEEDGIFLPPLRTLGFNPQLKINDSLLAQSYVEAYDISYPEAVQRIEDEVNELMQHLQNEGSYELNDIGTLELNEDGNYHFIPCEAGILTPALYGLDSFAMTRLGKVQPQVEPVETEEETYETEEDDDVVHIKFSWIRNTVAIAAVLLAIFLLALPTGKTEMMTRTISNINNSLFFGMMSKDTNTSSIDFKKCDIENPKPAVDTILKRDTVRIEKELSVEKQKTGYCIVLASYVTKKNAQAFVEDLQQRGYQESEVYIHKDVTRVIYGNFQTQGEAYNVLRKIHSEKGLEEAWVYKFN